MQRSTERILTTHVGSLPRPDDLFDLMLERMDGKAVDEKAYGERVRRAVRDCVRQQVDAGLDVVSDGEMAKPTPARPAISPNTISRRSPSRSARGGGGR
jgi:5-methyltetrahydropteroyltriglutamate--homocysteine methyltransferase